MIIKSIISEVNTFKSIKSNKFDKSIISEVNTWNILTFITIVGTKFAWILMAINCYF